MNKECKDQIEASIESIDLAMIKLTRLGKRYYFQMLEQKAGAAFTRDYDVLSEENTAKQLKLKQARELLIELLNEA